MPFGYKAGLLNLAEELGNISKACNVMGVTRDTFYRYQELVDQGVVAYAIDQPAHGQNRTSKELRKQEVFAAFAQFGCIITKSTLKSGLIAGRKSC